MGTIYILLYKYDFCLYISGINTLFEYIHVSYTREEETSRTSNSVCRKVCLTLADVFLKFSQENEWTEFD